MKQFEVFFLLHGKQKSQIVEVDCSWEALSIVRQRFPEAKMGEVWQVTADAGVDDDPLYVQSDPLAEFARRIIRGSAFEGGDIEGWDVQEMALEMGLIKKTEFDPDVHDDYTGLAEPGDEYYVFSKALTDPIRRHRLNQTVKIGDTVFSQGMPVSVVLNYAHNQYLMSMSMEGKQS